MITGIATSWAQQKLVLYYSENGTTKTVAEEIQKQLGADIEAVEAVEPYTGDFQATVQRGNKERQNGEWPAIKPLKSDLSRYDVIFLGYPIWYGTYANPIVTLLNGQDFAGKTIVPFCTFGSGGLNTSTADLKKALFDAACSSYQFPLGTPQTVGKRETPDGTDYKFSVKTRGQNGEEATATIYVTVEKGGKPEFTEVVR